VAYSFPPDFQRRVAARSLRVRLAPAVAGARRVGAWALRASIGVGLVASVALTAAALLTLAAAASSAGGDRDDRRGGGGRGTVRIDAFDVLRLVDLWYWFRPYPRYGVFANRVVQDGTGVDDPKAPMGTMEAAGSLLFGDGPPDPSWERRRWSAAASYISSRGGVVSPEELLPFVDVPGGEEGAGRLVAALAGSAAATGPDGGGLDPPDGAEAERAAAEAATAGWVTEALIRLGGEAAAFDDARTGARRVALVFPALQATAARAAASAAPAADVPAAPGGGLRVPPAIERDDAPLTRAAPAQRAGALALGAWNLLLVSGLSWSLRDPRLVLALRQGGGGPLLSVAATLLPALQALAVLFFAVPAVRGALLRRANRAAAARNAGRRAASRRLREDGGAARRARAASAAAALPGGLRSAATDDPRPELGGGRRAVTAEGEGAFVSDDPGRSPTADLELDDFDRRLRSRGKRTGGGGGRRN